MAINGLIDSRFLNAAAKGIQEIFEESASVLTRTRPLVWLQRLGMVDAEDGELMGRFTAKLWMADLIADDAKANVYKGGQLKLVLYDLAKIKYGVSLSPTELQKLKALEDAGGLTVSGRDEYTSWMMDWTANLLYGVLQRQNQLAAAMFLDELDYDRFGIKIVTGTESPWGMPTNLKVTVAIPWSSDGGATANTSATPLTDIWRMDQVDADNYGLGEFNRITMSRKAFRLMVQTTEFRDKAFAVLGYGFAPTSTSLPLANDPQAMELYKRIIGKELMFDDATHATQNADGSTSTGRYLPFEKVVLDRTSNTTTELDMGNGTVVESVVAGLTGGTMISGNPKMSLAGAKGPLGYFTAPSDLNPPSVTGWAVGRNWPRKHRPECTALLNVW